MGGGRFGPAARVGGRGIDSGASRSKSAGLRVPTSYLATVVGQTRRATGGDRSALKMVSGCSFNPNTTAILDVSPYQQSKRGHLGPLTGENGTGGFTKIEKRTSSRVVIKTYERTGDWLVVRQSYAPGWTATVDGKSEPIVRADVAFDAVHVPSGTNFVTLSYNPSSVSHGATLSILSLVIAFSLLGVAGTWWWRSRRGVDEEPSEV